MIVLRDVSYSYDGIPALSRISLSVARGESVAFIGPNGSGKSTLLKMISGIIHPDDGSYILDGEEITRSRLSDALFARRVHQRIGLLFQNPDTQLFCPAVWEEIAFGPRQMGLDRDSVDARVLDCLRLLGIEHLARRAPHNLSEGEKRRVALASVLALNPDVLALDEPMNGLDPRTKRFMRDVILSLINAGKTILCATHDFPYVEGVFTRAVVISGEHCVVRDDSYAAVIGGTAFLASLNIV
ncbi:MAG TPA: ABC transporter ATP-binding protein [Spirochaetia bacterium]|nr:ABC transporter ATP-binding protein [Spirochaetia bacterium]